MTILLEFGLTMYQAIPARCGPPSGLSAVSSAPHSLPLAYITCCMRVSFESGLEIGDLLLAIDGEAVQAADRLLGRVQGKRPGDTLLLTRRRGTTLDELNITLGSRPSR